MPLTINGETVDDGLLDAEFSQIKAHFEQQANISCCERDDEFMGYAKDNLIAVSYTHLTLPTSDLV